VIDMRLADIQPGDLYVAKIPYRVDPFVNEHIVDVVVEAVEVGVGYEVDTRHTTRIRGAAIHRQHASARKDGVRVRWPKQPGRSKFTGRAESCPAGEGVVPARNIERAAPDHRLNDVAADIVRRATTRPAVPHDYQAPGA
jgi:hypothetical protein